MRQALFLWIIAVITVSLMPLKFKLLLGTTGHWHSLGHYLVFFATTLIAGWQVKLQSRQVWTAVLVVLFGWAVEASEVFFYHNSFEWHDVLVDALGVLTGALLLQLLGTRSVAR